MSILAWSLAKYFLSTHKILLGLQMRRLFSKSCLMSHNLMYSMS